MSYSIKRLPECAHRPKPLSLFYGFITLTIFLAISVILTLIFGRTGNNVSFWLVALSMSTILWGVLISFVVLVWLLKDSKVNSFNKRRKQWILYETCRARRALQILNTTFITGHTTCDQKDIVLAMLNQESIVFSQTDRKGNESVRMSKITFSTNDNLNFIITNIFSQLIADLPVEQFPDKVTLVVVFDISTSIPLKNVHQLWEEAWQKNEMNVSVKYVEGNGLGVINHWLNTCIKDNSMLLIIALQIAPDKPDNTAEAAVALLLGNRLTQKTLEPLALLHRPDPADSGDLAAGMAMAAYNVPVKENSIKNLWLAGLNKDQRPEVIKCQNAHPAQSVENEMVISLDASMGHAGAAAPWLALAAAAEIAQQTQLPQMIISGDIAQDVLWSTLVTPIASLQEMKQ